MFEDNGSYHLYYNFRVISMIGKVFAIGLIAKTGRKLPYIICLVLTGITFLISLAFDKGVYYNNWPTATCGMLGNLFIASSFSILWIWVTEMYPTNMR